MTMPRELRIHDGHLYQTPVTGFETLRETEFDPKGALPAAGELEVQFDGGEADLNLFVKENGEGGFRIHYDSDAKKCTIDRTGMNKRFNQNVFEVLDMPLENGLKSLRIFIDRSSIELFANDGEAVFSSHVYPESDERFLSASDNVKIHGWSYRPSVTDDFVM
jgi:beta-fructofuranosidase